MFADFDTVYNQKQLGPNVPCYTPGTKPSFIGSYTPITPAGQMGEFNVNTYFLQDDRKSELLGPVAIRQFQLCGRRA